MIIEELGIYGKTTVMEGFDDTPQINFLCENF